MEKGEINKSWWWWFGHSVMSDSCNPMNCSPSGSSVLGILQLNKMIKDDQITSLRQCEHGRKKGGERTHKFTVVAFHTS